MVTQLEILIDAQPGWGAINRKTKGRGHTLSDQYIAFREATAYAVLQAQAKAEAAGEPFDLPLPWHRISVQLLCYWPTVYRTGKRAGIPRGDIDAPVKGTLDALEKAGVFPDDAQVSGLMVLKFHDPVQPRVLAILEELKGRR